MPFLTPRYAPELVVASLLIATFASYVSLDLAKRVRSPDRAISRAWWMGGSLAMGTGIWAMHFIGMFAVTLPIELGYRGLQTFASWVAAVGVSAVALGITASGALTHLRLIGGALSMGLGICAIHYIGMAALDMAPSIVWDWRWVAASGVIAVLASAVALLIISGLHEASAHRGVIYRTAAALVMGAAISGMHYSGMAAAGFTEGTVCLSAGALSGQKLAGLVMLASLLMLSMTLFTSTLDARLQGRTARMASSLQDANTELQSVNAELHRRAFIDPLTDLPNRLLFEDRLQHAVAKTRRGNQGEQRIAVLFVDLDGFKPINDSLGHAAGDEVLKEVAQRLRRIARESDTVARIGGDEFVLLMDEVPEPADAASLASRLLDALAEAITVGDQPLQISASVGIALYPDHAAADKLMQQADAAMFAAKRGGGNQFAFFEAHMDAKAQEQLSLQSGLRHAIAGDQLALHYQPKFDSRRGQIRGVEALLRWRHPQRGNIPPDVFIPVAERFGLINELGDWVLNEACRQMHDWHQDGLRLRVAINLSVHQLRQPDLGTRIAAALHRYGIEGSQLICEITESVAMEDLKTTQHAFAAISKIGVLLAIDDFGTGYSSLSYLRQLPVQQLKIDRSFVKDLESSADARAIVDAVIKLAHALSLRVVAEGVETAEQRDILVNLACDELQGYYFARPMSAAALIAWATERSPPQEEHVGFSPSVFAEDLADGLPEPSPSAR